MAAERAGSPVTAGRQFRIRTAFRNELRTAEIRVRQTNGGWEAQTYLLPRSGTNPLLSHEEKVGTAVVFRVPSGDAAADEMMRHLKQFFQLEIEDSPSA